MRVGTSAGIIYRPSKSADKPGSTSEELPRNGSARARGDEALLLCKWEWRGVPGGGSLLGLRFDPRTLAATGLDMGPVNAAF